MCSLVLTLGQFRDCPQQTNCYDCGIFAVAVSLHLIEGIPLTSTSFSQNDVTKARSALAKIFCSGTALMTSAVFRDFFPLLCGRNIIDSTGVEVINTRVARVAASSTQDCTDVEVINTRAAASSKPLPSHGRSTRSTNPTLSEGLALSTSHVNQCWREDIVNHANPNHEISLTAMTLDNIVAANSDVGDNAKGKKREHQEIEDKANHGVTSTATTIDEGAGDTGENRETPADTTFYRILHNDKIDSFKDLDDVLPVVEKYETLTGNRLRIQQSVLDKYRVFRCCAHVQCPFMVRFSKRHSDGKFVLSRMNQKHNPVPRSSKCCFGRQATKEALSRKA